MSKLIMQGQLKYNSRFRKNIDELCEPGTGDTDNKAVTITICVKTLKAIENRCIVFGISRSECVRRILIEGLKQDPRYLEWLESQEKEYDENYEASMDNYISILERKGKVRRME